MGSKTMNNQKHYMYIFFEWRKNDLNIYKVMLD
jgi:hypothetical protein